MIFQIKDGKKILIAAHGNSLRGIVKHLDSMSDDDIMGLNLPTGIPFVYKLDENLKPIESMKVIIFYSFTTFHDNKCLVETYFFSFWVMKKP